MTKLDSTRSQETAFSSNSNRSTVKSSNLSSAKSDSAQNLSFQNELAEALDNSSKSYSDIMMEKYNN